MDYDAYFIECDGQRLAHETILSNGTHVLCHNYHHPPVGRDPRLEHIGFYTLEDAVAYANTLPGHVRILHETCTVTECARGAICTCWCITLCYSKG